MSKVVFAACLALTASLPAWAGENPNAKLAMHVVASDEYLDCADLIPAACESINVDVSVEEILAANGYGYVALVAYDVEGTTGAEFAVAGWPMGRGAPLDGPTWCPEGTLTMGNPMDGGAIATFPCVEAGPSGIVLVGYLSFGPLDEAVLPIELEYGPSSFTYPNDPHNYVMDCTIYYREDPIVASTGCTIGGTQSEQPQCPEGEGAGWGPEGAPMMSFLGPPIQRAHNNGSVFALRISDLPSGTEFYLEREGERRLATARWVFDGVLECRAQTAETDIGRWDVVVTDGLGAEVRFPGAVRLVESVARTAFEEGGGEYIPGVVGVKIRHAGLALPDGLAEAAPHQLALCSEGLQRVFAEFGVSRIEKTFKDKTPADTLAECRPGQVVRVDDLSKYYELTFPEFVNVGDVLAALEALPEVLQVWPRGRKEWHAAPVHPDDSLYVHDKQWNLNQSEPAHEDADIDAPEAWGFGTVSGDMLIAVNDMGVHYEHEDLANTSQFPNWKVTCGYNFMDPGQDPNDPYLPGSGHGTLIAGIAAAVTDNDTGMAAVAWGNTSIASIKIGDAIAPYYSAPGMLYAVDSCHADVMNLSYSGGVYEADEGAAAHHANLGGVLVTAAAGNSGGEAVRYPAGCNYAIGVTATDRHCERPSYYYRGPHIDLAAPGMDVYGTSNHPDTLYLEVRGTSFATPHVCGLAALLKSIAQQREIGPLYPDDLLGLMCAGAEEVRLIPPPYPNKYVGWGKINAENAVRRLFWPYNAGQGPALYHAADHDTCYSDSMFTLGDPDTTYYRICVKKLVHHPACQDTPFVWGHTLWMTRGSIRDPHEEEEMEWSWCRVIPSSITASSCSLKTYLYYRMVAGKAEGEWVTYEPEQLTWSYRVSGIPGSLGVEDGTAASSARPSTLSQNYPNPFNPSTTIRFLLPDRQRVRISIYDAVGRLVRVLVDDELPVGEHEATWNGLDEKALRVSSGVYFYRLETQGESETKKMVLLR